MALLGQDCFLSGSFGNPLPDTYPIAWPGAECRVQGLSQVQGQLMAHALDAEFSHQRLPTQAVNQLRPPQGLGPAFYF